MQSDDIASILIVDDEPDIRSILGMILASNGHTIAEAADAAEARFRLREQHFDLVLCDVNMPGGSGLDLASDILGTYPEVAVVMVSGNDDRATAQRALDAGAYGYVIKPFRANEILINVANALRRRRLELDARKQREDLVHALRDRTALASTVTSKLEAADRKLDGAVEDTIVRLALAAELRDQETADHINRMSKIAGVLAREAGLGDERSRQIAIAARMHDVGKLGIPDRVLRKSGAFTDEERAVMALHPEMGRDVLSGSGSPLLDLAATIAYSHHERFDGTGYPRGLPGESIPLEGRIAALADVFDALTSERVYRRALSIPDTVALMRSHRGTHFDPELHDVFTRCLDEVVAVAERPLTSPDDRQLL